MTIIQGTLLYDFLLCPISSDQEYAVKRETHQLLAGLVGPYCPDPVLRHRMVEWMCEPDDARGGARHHDSQERLEEARSGILDARKEWIRGCRQQAVRRLCHALHYVQDGCVPGVRGDVAAHSNFESSCHRVLKERQFQQEIVSHHKPVEGKTDTLSLVNKSQPQQQSLEAARLALTLSIQITQSVLGPCSPPCAEELAKEMEEEFCKEAQRAGFDFWGNKVLPLTRKHLASQGLMRVINALRLRWALSAYRSGRFLNSLRRSYNKKYTRALSSLDSDWYKIPPLTLNTPCREFLAFTEAVQEFRILSPTHLADLMNKKNITSWQVLDQRWVSRKELTHYFGLSCP